MKSNILSKDIKNQAAENGKKRKRSSQVKENGDSVKEEKGLGTKTNANDLIKSVGFRQNGSRRKSKPRRAAERSLKEVRSAQKGFIGDAYSESQFSFFDQWRCQLLQHFNRLHSPARSPKIGRGGRQ
nr:neurofilament medium polypeptide-like [Ipomoea batatas]